MTSVITGDIINSRKLSPTVWIDELKNLLNTVGTSPIQWEIYRGDEFQLEVKPEDALITAIEIKALLRTLKLDVRMSIGFGDKTYQAAQISESNGTAFIRSGAMFENLKKQKTNLAVNSGDASFDIEMNLMLRLALSIMDHWLVQSAEYVLTAIRNQKLSQEELGQKLGINQAAVSRRRKRAYFDLIADLEAHYREKIKTIST
ncbi:MAG TPA: SatD family protein [Flavobacterium sp.]|jgi:predicted XRE-type DNA-binding protein